MEERQSRKERLKVTREMVVPEKRVPFAKDYQDHIETMYEVRLIFKEAHMDESGDVPITYRWLYVEGAPEDCEKATDYIRALLTPEELMSLPYPAETHDYLMDPRTHCKLERSSGAAILFQEGYEMTIQGRDTLSVTLAVSAIEEKINQIMDMLQLGNTSFHHTETSVLLDRELERMSSVEGYDAMDLSKMKDSDKIAFLNIMRDEEDGARKAATAAATSSSSAAATSGATSLAAAAASGPLPSQSVSSTSQCGEPQSARMLMNNSVQMEENCVDLHSDPDVRPKQTKKQTKTSPVSTLTRKFENMDTTEEIEISKEEIEISDTEEETKVKETFVQELPQLAPRSEANVQSALNQGYNMEDIDEAYKTLKPDCKISELLQQLIMNKFRTQPSESSTPKRSSNAMLDVIDLTSSPSGSAVPLIDLCGVKDQDNVSGDEEQNTDKQKTSEAAVKNPVSDDCIMLDLDENKDDEVILMGSDDENENENEFVHRGLDTLDTFSLPYSKVTKENKKKHTYPVTDLSQHNQRVQQKRKKVLRDNQDKTRERSPSPYAQDQRRPKRDSPNRRRRGRGSPAPDSPNRRGGSPNHQQLVPYGQHYSPHRGSPTGGSFQSQRPPGPPPLHAVGPFDHLPIGGTGPGLSGSQGRSDGMMPYPSTSTAASGSGSRKKKLRYIVIDGSNMAMEHGKTKYFSCRGMKLVIEWFERRGHKEIKVIIPQWRSHNPAHQHPPIRDFDILAELKQKDQILLTPSRQMQDGRKIACYDDRFVLRTANMYDGVVVSNDYFKDLYEETSEFREVIDKRLLPVRFIDDNVLIPDDPLGKDGPMIDEFLSHPDPNNPPCKERRVPVQSRPPPGHYAEWAQAGRPMQPSQPHPLSQLSGLRQDLSSYQQQQQLHHQLQQQPQQPQQYQLQLQQLLNTQQAQAQAHRQPQPWAQQQGMQMTPQASQAQSQSSHQPSRTALKKQKRAQQQQQLLQQQLQQQQQHRHQAQLQQKQQEQQQQQQQKTPKKKSPRPVKLSQEYYVTLQVLFPGSEAVITRILQTHPTESDLNALSNYIVEDMEGNK